MAKYKQTLFSTTLSVRLPTSVGNDNETMHVTSQTNQLQEQQQQERQMATNLFLVNRGRSFGL